jgi:hypothetical protein
MNFKKEILEKRRILSLVQFHLKHATYLRFYRFNQSLTTHARICRYL